MMGIDLSKSSPGIAILNTNTRRLIHLDKFVFKKPKNETTMDRYMRYYEIKAWIDDIITTFRPEKIILEDAFMSSMKANSNITLLRLHGYIGMNLLGQGAELKLINPSSSRAFLKIKPNTKEEAFNWIKENFPEAGLDTFKKDNDKADAIVLALNGLNGEKLKEW